MKSGGGLGGMEQSLSNMSLGSLGDRSVHGARAPACAAFCARQRWIQLKI